MYVGDVHDLLHLWILIPFRDYWRYIYVVTILKNENLREAKAGKSFCEKSAQNMQRQSCWHKQLAISPS
jgi:hypothetical protein